MGNRRIAIVTWIKWYNFGTYLQAYALQQVIKGFGYDVWTLNDSDVVEEGLQKQYGKSRRISYIFAFAKQKIWNAFQFMKQPRKRVALLRKSRDLYLQFSDSFLKIDNETFPLSDLDNRYDVFVCGSDQIWHPSLNIFSPYYYLGFTKKKKIAYAPSIGTSNYSADFINKVKPLLSDFSQLSIREKVGADIISRIADRKVDTVVDPTLLLGGNYWEKLVLPYPPVSGNYILCYFLSYNETYFNYVKDYAQRKSLSIVTFCLEGVSQTMGDTMIAAGPQEFLSAIKYAACVFTDSFHGTIFSLHFKKHFVTFKRFAESTKNNQNSRVSNLFKMIRLEDYFIGKNDLSKVESLPDIDYSLVEDRLHEERNHSICYLKKALENKKNM